MSELADVLKEVSAAALYGDKEIIEVLKKVVNLQVTMVDKIERIEKDFDRALRDLRDFAKATAKNAQLQSAINDDLRIQIATLKSQLDQLLQINGGKVQ